MQEGAKWLRPPPIAGIRPSAVAFTGLMTSTRRARQLAAEAFFYLTWPNKPLAERDNRRKGRLDNVL
jgi:hypothetical protein